MNKIWVWSIDGITLPGENRSTQRKTCPSALFSTKNYTRAGLGSKLGLRGEGPTTNAWATRHGLTSLNESMRIKCRLFWQFLIRERCINTIIKQLRFYIRPTTTEKCLLNSTEYLQPPSNYFPFIPFVPSSSSLPSLSKQRMELHVYPSVNTVSKKELPQPVKMHENYIFSWKQL